MLSVRIETCQRTLSLDEVRILVRFDARFFPFREWAVCYIVGCQQYIHVHVCFAYWKSKKGDKNVKTYEEDAGVWPRGDRLIGDNEAFCFIPW